jgi:tripartite-type tricarboxylate transporter receptor subunit TctC
MRLTGVMLAVSAAMLVATAASAQSYPSKPIRVIVPFTPGSSTDITARAVGDRLTAELGQPIVIENRAGAGGRVGAEVVAKAAPDGYTLLINSSAHTANPAMYKDMPFDTANDFAGITALANLPNILIISPDKKLTTAKALVDWAKVNPEKLNFASAGAGSATHMNAEKFSARAGIKHTHVPYRGTPEAITDVMAGRADVYFAPLNAALPFIQDNKVMALAVGTAKRTPLLPNVPTTIEAGIPDSDYNFWVGMFVPAKTPRDVIDRLNAATVKVLQSPEVEQRFRSLGATAMPMKPAEYDSYIKNELASIAELVKTANIKIE